MSIINNNRNIDSIGGKICNLPWTLVFYDKGIINLNLIRMTTNILKSTLNVNRVILYAPLKSVTNMLEKINFLEYQQNDNLSVFDIVDFYIVRGESVIFFNDEYGLSNSLQNISVDKISASFIQSCDLDDNSAYDKIIRQFNLIKLISPNVLFIPINLLTTNYWTTARRLRRDILLEDPYAADVIALTLADIEFPNAVIPLPFIPLNITDRAFARNLLEYDPAVVRPRINRLSKNHTYYPFLDRDAVNNRIVDVISEINLDNISYNTNGFTPTLETTETPFNNLIRRFDSADSGLFIPNSNLPILIPRIIHLVQFPEFDNQLDSLVRWENIINPSWQIRTWNTQNFLLESELNPLWIDLYNYETDPKLRMLIMYLAILERYGGFILGSNVVPIRLFSEDLLSNKFLVSFENEAIGTNISYQIMGSIATTNRARKINVDANSGRTPFIGSNNYFIDIARNNLSKNTISTDTDIFGRIYNILNIYRGDTSFNNLQNLLVNNPDVMIYPSYYFNPTANIPNSLGSRSYTRIENREVSTTTYQKPSLRRTINTTPYNRNSRLTENPRDRLRNLV